MAILVLTTQPARIRRGASGIADELVFDSDPAALQAPAGEPWRLVLVDQDMGELCLSLVSKAVATGSRVMVIAREPSLHGTMQAIQAGACDVVMLPLDTERIRRAIKPIRTHKRSWEEAVSHTPLHEWVGSSPAMLDAFRLAARAAAGDMNVLIIGESGVGKELLARIVHDHSARAVGPFGSVNCAALDETMLAVELFGSDAAVGPQGGAVAGQLTRAAGGALFLDDIAELGTPLQARLAAAMQEKQFLPIAGFERRKLETRIIAAANRDLRAATAAGQFREDLLYQFGAEIVVPPLRRRTEDIPVLASYFLDQFARVHRKDVHGFEAEALDVLAKYDWPGNVRQLRSVIERSVMASSGRAVRTADLAPELTSAPEQVREADLGSVALEAIERRHIRKIWRITGGHLGETADLLGIHRNTLRRKLEQYGITEEDARV